MANRPGIPAAGAGSATAADRLERAQRCPADRAPMGRAAGGLSPALGIASILLPRAPLLPGWGWTQGTSTVPEPSWLWQAFGGCSWCWEIACARHGHSLHSAVPWHHPGQCHLLGGCLELLGEAGREGTKRDRRDGGAAPWPDGEGSSQCCQVLQVASVPARGGNVAGTEPVRVPGPWQRLAPLPTGTWGKGTGLAATAAWPTASTTSNATSSTCPPHCQHRPQAPQPHGDPARSQPLRALAKLPGRGKRVTEYLHPSLQHRQPGLMPPISTGQLFHLSPPPPPISAENNYWSFSSYRGIKSG